MERVITYNCNDDFIAGLAELLYRQYYVPAGSLEGVACVFGGQRPGLFLRRALAAKIQTGFIPPAFFSIDTFVDALSGEPYLPVIGELDACYLIYELVGRTLPDGRKKPVSFGAFLPWAGEIISFIEQLDLEDINNEALSGIQQSAAIGYEVPENINRLLKDIVAVRSDYHTKLAERGFCSRGLKYLNASKAASGKLPFEFDTVIFCNFFYLHATEEKIIKTFLDSGKGICIFQGSQDDWSVLGRNAQKFSVTIRPKGEEIPRYQLQLYEGFDLQSQACLVREILDKKIKDKNKTVVVVPRAEAIVPLLSEIASFLPEYNISLGYPLQRTTLYALFEALARAQKSRRADTYYSRDYLRVIRHPLVRHLTAASLSASLVPVLVEEIEELLRGDEESSVGGSLFVALAALGEEPKVYERTIEKLKSYGLIFTPQQCRDAFTYLHDLLFRAWEGLSTFREFTRSLDSLLGVLVESGSALEYRFNTKAIASLYEVQIQLQRTAFSEEKFSGQELWDIFIQKLRSHKVPFKGSPLKGTQILGLFETRSLNFESVIIMDMNESVFPKLKVYEPLIPREVMLSLGLNRLEKEEEIQRYQFMRLIAAAKDVHLVYAEDGISEKSRFIEELLWKQEKEKGSVYSCAVPKASFSFKVPGVVAAVEKTAPMVKALKEAVYSASRVNTYLSCPMQFYFQYVLGLTQKDDLLEGPEAATVGTFIHKVLEEGFSRFKSRQPILDSAFEKIFFKMLDERFEREIAPRMRSDSFLLKRIITARLRSFLESERSRGVVKIICLEEERSGTISLNDSLIKFVYTVDRIDQLDDNAITIIDYKTGGSDFAPRRLSSLEAMAMERGSIRDTVKSFQLPLYYYFIARDFPHRTVNAELYNIRTLERTPFIHPTEEADKEKIMDICLKALAAVFKELFDESCSFTADGNERRCANCQFRMLCR